MTSAGLNGRYWNPIEGMKYYTVNDTPFDNQGFPLMNNANTDYYYYGNSREIPGPDSGNYKHVGTVYYKMNVYKFYILRGKSIDDFFRELKKISQFKNLELIDGQMGIPCSTSSQAPGCLMSGGRRKKTRRKKTIRRKLKSRKVTRNKCKNRK
jgi:hypothetical protein